MMLLRRLQWKRLGRDAWSATISAIFLFVLVALPYVVYVHRVTGYWTLSGKQGVTMEIAMAYAKHDQAAHDRAVASLDDTGTEILWLSREQYRESPFNFVLQDPPRFAGLVRANWSEMGNALFSQDLFQPGIIMLAALGLFVLPWSRKRLVREAWMLATILPLGALLAFFVLSRFLVLAVPIVLIWAAFGVAHLDRWLVASLSKLHPVNGRSWQKALAMAPLALVGICFLAMDVRTAEAEISKMAFSHAEAGQWLEANVPPGTVLMARDTEVALYAGMPCVAFPNAEWHQVLAYARSHGAHYLVVDEWTIKEYPSLN